MKFSPPIHWWEKQIIQLRNLLHIQFIKLQSSKQKILYLRAKISIMLARFITFTFLSICLLIACQSEQTASAENNNSAANATPASSDVKQEAADEVYRKSTKPLFVRFLVRYLERDKRLKSTVNFYQQANGMRTPIKLENDAKIEGRNMRFKNLNDQELRYEDLYDVEIQDQYSFQFNALDGQTHTYPVKMPIVKNFAIEGKLKKSEGGTITTESEALTNREMLIVMFTDSERHTENISLFGPLDLSNIPLSAAQLKNLTVGRNEIRMVRKSSLQVKEKTYAGECNAEYYSEPIIVEVVD